MIVLALEMSSEMASACLLDEGNRLYEMNWSARGRHRGDLISRIRDLIKGCGIKQEDIGLYAVGRGPGNYSGMRVALTTAQAMALPSGKPVYTISSGQAAAMDVMQKARVHKVVVLGDARRRALWCGTFWMRDDFPLHQGDWRLIPYQIASRYGFDTEIIISSERSRVAPHLGDKKGLLTPTDWFPSAEKVGQAAWLRWKAGKPSDPLSPIYLHPPVEKQPDPVAETQSG